MCSAMPVTYCLLEEHCKHGSFFFCGLIAVGCCGRAESLPPPLGAIFWFADFRCVSDPSQATLN
ncbi:hypothetical protein P3371_24710, partial [Vibrio parahaemolyticus]|nr:hypothetical protein [Vibrio parahaemolyticus]